MDGEGTITIKRVRYARDKERLYYQPYISCAQTIRGKVAIDKLQQLFGGYLYRYQEKRGDRLPTYTWAVASRDAQKCAHDLLPYLVLKVKQAKLLIEFYRLMTMKKKAYRLARTEDRKRERLFLQMRKLNVKGKLRLERLNEKDPVRGMR